MCASIGLCLGWVHDMPEGGERVHVARVAHVELLNCDRASRVATRTELLPRGEQESWVGYNWRRFQAPGRHWGGEVDGVMGACAGVHHVAVLL